MKQRLIVTYGDSVRFDGEVDEIITTENGNSFTVKARLGGGRPLAGLLEQLANKRKEPDTTIDIANLS